MSTQITSTASRSYFNFYGIPHQNLYLLDHPAQRSITTIKGLKWIDRPHLTCSAKRRTFSVVSASGSPSSESSSSPWKKWLLGILFTVILPAAGHKGGLFLGLKGKIDNAIETVEHVTEIVEDIAEEADRIVEEVEKKLPNDSKLREALESFDDLTKMAVKEAKKAEDLVHKVKDVEGEIEEALTKVGKDQVEK